MNFYFWTNGEGANPFFALAEKSIYSDSQYLALALAIYGSILSTILAVLKILEYRKDRPNVKVTVQGNWTFNTPTTVYGNKRYVVIRATNKGRRPVTLELAALLKPRKKSEEFPYIICADPYTAAKPVELTEGKSHDYLLLEEGLDKDCDLAPNKYVACVRGATGKFYWSHNILQRLIKLHRIKRPRSKNAKKSESSNTSSDFS